MLNDSQVHDLIDMAGLLDAIHDGYRSQYQHGAQLPDRINLTSAPGFFRLMPGVVPGFAGFKVFNQVAAGGVQYLIGVYDEPTGELLALLDGAYLTAARTGATTGVAARLLGPSGPTEVGLIGSGLEARTNLEAVVAALDVTRVLVFSPNAERRAEFAAEMSKALNLEVVPVETPQDAAGAPVVIAATNTGIGTGRIALEGAWLSPGATVLSIGSTMPELREFDTTTVAKAAIVVSDAPEQARLESGDLLAADAEGVLDGKLASLADVVGGKVGVGGPTDVKVFKSVGTALQDLVAAHFVAVRARTLGVGEDVQFLRTKMPAGK